MASSERWSQRVEELARLRREVNTLSRRRVGGDGDELLPDPGAAPDPEEIRSTRALLRRELNVDLNPEHIELLRRANGWQSLFVFTDLFSLAQLREGGRLREVLEVVEVFDEACGAVSELVGGVSGLVPIANCDSYLSIVCTLGVASRRSAHLTGGEVLWVWGVEPQLFGSFEAFWDVVMRHNQYDLEGLRGSQSPTS